MISKAEAPWFGAAYYPEGWDENAIDEDIGYMHEAKMNAMRIGEFAWGSMEPANGEFEFGWLDKVLTRLRKENIMVVLGTPSATPPSWLTVEYPDMLAMNDDGVRKQHGERRHCCSNNPEYIAYTKRIVKEMAVRYAENDAVIGWQIDNEICYSDRGCFCHHCIDGFHKYLEDKYKTIGELDERLGLTLWSMKYDRFEDIPAPASRTWAHPSFITEWLTFQSLSNASFVSMQADALKENGVKTPIGTDMMPILEQDYISTNKNLDVIQFNHYNDQTNLNSLIFWNDFLRNLKDVPFWNTETSTCWGGATYPNGFMPEGFCTANTWLSYAMGAQCCMYWLWRSHRAGQEMMHGSVITSTGRPMHTFAEVRKIGEDLITLKDVLTETKVVSSGIGLHMSHHANNMFKGQAISKDMEGWAVYVKKLFDYYYRPMLECQIRPDVIDPSADLEKYKIIITPFMPFLDESGLQDRMIDWVEKGGTWIAGPLTDIRTIDGTKFTKAPMGCLEKYAGVKMVYQIPSYPVDFTANFRNGSGFDCRIQCDGFEVTDKTQALAFYNEPPLKGLAAVTSRKVGKGVIYMLGTVLSQDAFSELIMHISSLAGILPIQSAESNILTVKREGNGRSVLFCIEYKGMSGILSLHGKKKDLISGRKYNENVIMKPFEILCLEDYADLKNVRK